MMRRLALLLLLAGCATTTPTTAPPSAAAQSGTPAWVVEGSRAVDENASNRVFRGVGKSSDGDVVTRRQKAEAAARAELAKLLDSYAAATMSASKPEAGDQGDSLQGGLHTILKEQVEMAPITGHWSPPDRSAEYAEATISYTAVKVALLSAPNMTPSLHQSVSTRADAAFQELAAEEARHSK